MAEDSSPAFKEDEPSDAAPKYVYFSISDEPGSVRKFATRDVVRNWPIMRKLPSSFQLLVYLKDGTYVIYNDSGSTGTGEVSGMSQVHFGCTVSARTAAEWLLRNEEELPPGLVYAIPSGSPRDGASDDRVSDSATADEREEKTDPAITADANVPQSVAIKRPSEKAFQVWRLRDAFGINNQTELAAKMTENGSVATQGQVSRWLKQVENYIATGNILPHFTPGASRPQSLNPAIIEMGKRQDGRTPRQRSRRNSDPDD